MDIVALVTQLQAIEKRYAPPGGAAPESCAAQLAEWRKREDDREEVCTTRDPTAAWYLLRLCRRYGIRPFRRPKQKPTTICVRVPAGFMSKVLWPQVREAAVVFERARRAAVDELVAAWLGPAIAEEPLFVDEEAAR